VEYWVRSGGNSGISIRDTSRAKYGILMPVDYKRTPSKIGYEIQINNRFPDPHPTGSIYGFQDAQGDFLKENDWNTLDIESRQELIRVKLNGHTVAEHAGDPARSKTGPIGLQLHDRFSTVMFRSVQIRELK
jgi:3-keto-disaccharide hydrolase